MTSTAERVTTRVSKSKAAVAALAATATLLAGCSGSHSKKEVNPAPKPVPTTTAPTPTTPTTSEAAPFNSFAYETNPQRNARIVAAVQSFGAIVLEQSKSSGSTWGPFDSFCSPGTYMGSNATGSVGWVSQGYKPTAGQNCVVQHNPQYGGENMQVMADVVVGANGVYTDKIQGVTVNNAHCTTNIMFEGSNLGWEAQIGKGTVSASTDTTEATSLAQAQAIDAQALACLAATRP